VAEAECGDRARAPHWPYAHATRGAAQLQAHAGNIVDTVKQQLRPLFDQVVIKELEPDRVRRSGLLLPPGEHETPPQHGIVLAVGPGLDWWGGVGIKMPVAPGDHVVFPGSAGVWVDIEEERLLVCRVGQLLGVLEEVDEPKGSDPSTGYAGPAARD
jgi:chaperonin GroES